MEKENVLLVHPEEVTKKLCSVLSRRTRDILEMRFGLGKTRTRMTLESIGEKYGITRERVRQIETDALGRIQRSPAMREMEGVFTALENFFDRNGGVLKEASVLQTLAPHPKHENHVYFLLVLHQSLDRHNENDDFHSRWAQSSAHDERAQKTIMHATNELRRGGHPISEPQLFEILSASSRVATGSVVAPSTLSHWLNISKLIAKNYFGEWGLAEFSTIRPRGMRDLSYLVMNKKNTPMHFTEVASAIRDLTGKKAHVQTVHNELIKDDRFVLVGRGLYALAEWGYQPGTVKDMISSALKEHGALSKDRIITLVSQKRLVKPNTIAINLDNKKNFKKLPDGTYSIRS